MRKIFGLALALTLLLAACSAGPDVAGYTTEDAKRLLDAGAFSGEMEELDAYALSMLYGIDEADISECAGYMAINASVSADEVAVLVLAGEEEAAAAAEACQKRVEKQIDSYETYCPDQVPRLEDAVILRRGNTVLFAVGDPDRLPQALEELALD